jgi:PKD repeat protein
MSKCPSDSVLLGGEVINSNTYYWSPYFQTTPTIYASAPGLYIVQVVSTCGTAVDSLVVTDYPSPTASFTTNTSFYTVVTNNTSTNGASYHWDFGDGNTSTDFSPSHLYAADGTYTITLTVVSECGDTSVTTMQVVVHPEFGGVENEELGHVNIYPNPSEGYFNVSLASATGEDIRITVQDLAGRMIFESVYGSSEGEFNTAVDIRGVAAGTYMLRLQSGKYSTVSKLIVR